MSFVDPPPRQTDSETPRRRQFPMSLLHVAMLLVGVGLLYQMWSRPKASPTSTSGGVNSRTVVPRGNLADDEQSTIELFRESSRSVVFITTATRREFSLQEVQQGTGSGFIWDDEGHIVTNFHVVDGGERFRVTLADQSNWDAQPVGVAPHQDLAILKIEAPPEKLRAIPLGESHDLQVGQKVFAIGNPFGLDQTLTTGVISGLERQIESKTSRPIEGVIQTDAAINPGNSGGPLLDSSGRLIGVNTAIYSPSGASAGIGFAIPADAVAQIVPRLIGDGRIVRAGMGVQIMQGLATQLGIEGVAVMRVPSGSAGEAAGLQGVSQNRLGDMLLGDIIVAIDSQPIRNKNDLFRVLDGKLPGDTVVVTVLRNAKTSDERRLDLPLRLQALD